MISSQQGDIDYLIDRGLEELDPNCLPNGLSIEYNILTDEMTTYNYKANYEQQVQIEQLKILLEQLMLENQILQEKIAGIENMIK